MLATPVAPGRKAGCACSRSRAPSWSTALRGRRGRYRVHQRVARSTRHAHPALLLCRSPRLLRSSAGPGL